MIPAAIKGEVHKKAMEKLAGENVVRDELAAGQSPREVFDRYGILRASAAAGLKRFVFHPEVMGASEWRVLTEVCGTPWREDPSGYWPSGTQKPDDFNGGRRK